ncbi:MAG: class I SAM-dependent methyltransferase, partial [Planctomycetes bacterium]|nr:class I SAM-dependent methyltransferase [Planctomycetota bacterium]
AFTGLFPRHESDPVPYGPLHLVKCAEATGGCGLVQLRHSFDGGLMYGDSYGYRSGLNASMVRHLAHRVAQARRLVDLTPGDVVVDIGSNDSTTLRCYGDNGYRLIGIDPSAAKFRSFYPSWVEGVPQFFSAETFRNVAGTARARIVTSIAMFYDLQDPTHFMREVREILAADGIWAFEQSYLPLMIERNAYDTICHEHVSYYALRQIDWMARRTGLKVIDVELNDVNGGSFCVTVCRDDAPFTPHDRRVDSILEREQRDGYGSMPVYDRFREGVHRHRDDLSSLIRRTNAAGKTVCGYGASTKGNVVLQWCGLTSADIPVIAEVNDDKFGCVTPHTLIPIASEREVRGRAPDCLLVLPWHFHESIVQREQAYLDSGGTLLFPLPRIEAVSRGRTAREAA